MNNQFNAILIACYNYRFTGDIFAALEKYMLKYVYFDHIFIVTEQDENKRIDFEKYINTGEIDVACVEVNFGGEYPELIEVMELAKVYRRIWVSDVEKYLTKYQPDENLKPEWIGEFGNFTLKAIFVGDQLLRVRLFHNKVLILDKTIETLENFMNIIKTII